MKLAVLLLLVSCLAAEVSPNQPKAAGCTITLQKQLSSTRCAGNFGCFKNDTRFMWAGDGCRGNFLCNGHPGVACGDGFHKRMACPCSKGPVGPPPPIPPPVPPPPPPPAPPHPPAPPAPRGPLCNLNGTWNMTVGVGPVLNGGMHLSDMHIMQAEGSRNYSLHWRDGHVAGFHPTAFGSFPAGRNHSMVPDQPAPHLNWGIQFEGTVSASPYSGWAVKGQGGPDCSWISFCTACCRTPGPDCCCVDSKIPPPPSKPGKHRQCGGSHPHPCDTPTPKLLHWCKHPYCPYQLPPPPPPPPQNLKTDDSPLAGLPALTKPHYSWGRYNLAPNGSGIDNRATLHG